MSHSLSLPSTSQDRSLPYISVVVIVMHCLLLIFALRTPTHLPIIIKPVKHLVVKTVTLQPIPEQLIAERKIEPAPIFEPAPAPEPEIKPKPEPTPEPIPEPAPQPIPEPASEPAPPPKPTPEPIAPKPKPEPQPVKPKPEPKPKEPPKPIKKAEPVKKPEVKKDPPKPKVSEKPKPAPKPAAKEVKTQPSPKKNPPKKEEKPKPPAPDPKVEAAKARKRELLSQAQKSIGKIEQSHGKISSGQESAIALSTVPGKIESLQIETARVDMEPGLSTQEVTYYEELANRLKMLLRLPEYGEVKIKLTLDRTGGFKKVDVVSTKSDKNKKYIEKTLPTLKFPGFGKNFSGQEQYTFIIILSNDF